MSHAHPDMTAYSETALQIAHAHPDLTLGFQVVIWESVSTHGKVVTPKCTFKHS